MSAKTRKMHTKSRGGCLECKRRHLKCDEGRPTCRKCICSKRDCFYNPPATPQSSQASSDLNPVIDRVASVQDRSQSEAFSTSLYQPPTAPTSEVNVDHIELFHHFITVTCNTVAITESQINLYRRIVVERCFSEPFLLDQVLALSACHMSLQRPSRAAFYRDLAAQRQTSAIAGYQDILCRIDASNCLDVLLFSHLLALHVFWEIFTPLGQDFSVFLERLVGCIRLLRGINLVIRTWWGVLTQTDLGPIILRSDEQQNTPKESRRECEGLREMLDQADLSASSIQTCHNSLTNLQMYFDSDNMLEDPSASTHQIFAWLITTSEGYSDLLDQRRPEALVLLAYYSVLLHRRHKSWIIGDAGSRLLVYIQQHLGSRWSQWLAWPKSAIFGTHSSAS